MPSGKPQQSLKIQKKGNLKKGASPEQKELTL